MASVASKPRDSAASERPGERELEPGAPALPPVGDSIGRYRYMVKAASPEAIERASAEMLATLEPADEERVCDRLDQSPELAHAEPRPGVEEPPSRLAQEFFSGKGALQAARESDPDISDEFGYANGYAGGSGFEGVEFDRWT